MSRLAIPGCIAHITPEDEVSLLDLFRQFGNARRRAYNLLQRGVVKSDIERILQEEMGVNSRYAKDAYHSIKDLPSHWTCGGLRNQRLREKKRITREEYRARRDSIIISRGDKTKKGNLNTRLIKTGHGLELRINVLPREEEKKRWVYPEVFIPEKYFRRYGWLLDGSRPYMVQIKRRDNGRGYALRIIVEVPQEERELIDQRVMALDVNAGHIDFAVAEPHRALATGKINCHEAQYASTNKTMNILHKTIAKIINIARHYKTKVVLGNLNTAKYSGLGARKIKGIPHHKIAHILGYKFGDVEKHSEAYTSMLAKEISPKVGLDVHKVSACIFALKVLDHDSFSSLKDELFPRSVAPDEGIGSLRRRLSVGSELTAPGQAFGGGNIRLNGLAGDEVTSDACDGGYSAIPGSRGLLNYLRSLENNLPCLQVRTC